LHHFLACFYQPFKFLAAGGNYATALSSITIKGEA